MMAACYDSGAGMSAWVCTLPALCTAQYLLLLLIRSCFAAALIFTATFSAEPPAPFTLCCLPKVSLRQVDLPLTVLSGHKNVRILGHSYIIVPHFLWIFLSLSWFFSYILLWHLLESNTAPDNICSKNDSTVLYFVLNECCLFFSIMLNVTTNSINQFKNSFSVNVTVFREIKWKCVPECTLYITTFLCLICFNVDLLCLSILHTNQQELLFCDSGIMRCCSTLLFSLHLTLPILYKTLLI